MAEKSVSFAADVKDVDESDVQINAVEEKDAHGRVRQTHLAFQDVENLDPAKLTPLTPEVISRQATINIGTIGHVAHGKSTVVKSLSGVKTVRFKNELERNITIKLGYANAKIYECVSPDCPKPGSFTSRGSNTADVFEDEKGTWELRRHVSFVDCPGHDILMATMLNGAAVMDAALLLIAGNESCPQPQTSEHLAAVEIMKLQNIIILQNKIDLVKEDAAIQQHEQIRQFVAGTVADKSPIIPISAVLKYNIDVVCEYMCKHIPVPPRDFTSSPHMIVIRSFDVNKPGQDIDSLKGGVAGGSILYGILKVGDDIEVRPGISNKRADGTVKCLPIRSKVVSLYAEENDLNYAVPGGLIGVGTKIDPTLTRADRLVGHVLGHPGSLPEVYTEVEINFYLLRRLLGVKTSDGGKGAKVSKLQKNEVLLVNIGSTSTGCTVVAMRGDLAKIQLMDPVCTKEGEKVALSRRVEKHWRLVGWGTIRRGSKTVE
mmetsp:Transcript_11362/g.22206  ORF Transcript_11362/g.22206 Transcript_11362/m.22206 type:complete len:488 (-) Transcript_11362:117-1580(-)|eukprot:CAMPEP_0171503228 /NCGR_PEP_ID=MMETSP0958-20121227/10743_1 /TAXON_ID=87120 /ORGANISM="Aurantiochytrium limacinum, Strain ATCCMYA-1381" /LENGTH=487 /DNA_ID=CAMNT_0012038623 /DNA_START=230 /DNA_END=1693 /DNA_ORIENTATION=-